MATQVLLTGASGLVGTWLRRTAPPDVEVVSLVHRTAVAGASVTADVRDAGAVAAAFAEVRPSLVIHAAMAVDADSILGATAHVAEQAALVGADLVHLSTDAVFAGDGRPVDEGARPDPIWDYGRWKAQAEELVMRTASSSAFVRLPLVVSLDPADAAVQRIRTAADAGEVSRWFDDELRQPAMAADLAAGIWRIASLPPDRRAGAWHLVGPETLTRHQIAQRVAATLGLDPTSVLPEPTPPGLVRPRHLDLRCDRARSEIAWDPAPVLT